MRTFILPFFLLITSYLFPNNYENLANQSYAQRQRSFLQNFYHNPIFKDSIAFFKEVNELKKVALKYNDQELLLETELMFFNYLSSKNYSSYKVGMQELIKKVDKTGIPHLQARTRQALGLHYYYEDMNYAKAIHYLNESYDYLQPLTEKELPDKQEMVFNIASIHFNIGYLETAVQYIKIAETLTNNYYETLLLNIINTKGLIYKSKANEKLCIESFEQLLELAHKQKQIAWVSIAQNQLAETYIKHKKFDKAVEILSGEGIEDKEDEIENEILIRRLQLYATIYIEQENQQEALKVISRIIELSEKSPSDPYIHLLNLPLLAYQAGSKGEFKEAYLYIKEALKSTTEAHRYRVSKLVEQAENKEEIERYFRQKIELENAQKVKKISLISSCIIVVLLILIALVFFQRQRSVYRTRQLKVILEKKSIQEKLHKANNKLADLKNSILSKNLELEKYREELESIEKSSTKDDLMIQRAQTLNELLNKPILTDENWITFKQAFDNVHVGFSSKLNEQLPGLTQAELRYLILQKLNLSGKEIAAILGISFDSLRSYKFRIRKKYNLSQDEEITDLIQSI